MAGISSNPNSPRQKMINLMYLVFIAMMALNVSSEVLDGFALVEGSLQTSLDNTSQRNTLYTEILSNEYRNNQEKVEKWYDRGLTVSKSSEELYDYIQDLKVQIVKQADGKKGDVNNIKHQDDLEAASRIMLAPINGQGKVLRERIDEFRDNLKEMVDDDDIRKILDVSLNTEAPKKAGLNIRTWENALFENMPVAAAVTLLTKLQNDIRYSQGEVLSYLLKSIDAADYKVNQLQAQVIPTSQIIMQGTQYEGQIVLSAVDSTQRPTIFIGDQILPDEDRGFYRITPPGLGEQVFRGRMKTADGAEHEFESRYYVTERMAAVSPLKMNVLYAEYDNDLSIAVPGVTNERVTASITNGTLTKRGNIWVARPNRGATNATVTVNAAGGTIPYQFRVLPLPDPIPYIQYTDANGDVRKFKGGTLAKRTLVETDQILAGYDDGLLDVNFTVTEFVMYHFDSFGNTISLVSNSGRLTDQQKNTIRNFSRGQRFFISRVKARADGQQESTSVNFPLEITVN